MTDYSPRKARPRPKAPPPQLSRAVWQMRSDAGKVIHAGIYDVPTGRELRVSLGDELLESRRPRRGDAPLEDLAQKIRQLLVTKGWSDLDCA